jgi:hypothetical protein
MWAYFDRQKAAALCRRGTKYCQIPLGPGRRCRSRGLEVALALEQLLARDITHLIFKKRLKWVYPAKCFARRKESRHCSTPCKKLVKSIGLQ